MKATGDKVNLKLFPTSLNLENNKYSVIYFYPKDETPGCTVEACEFRDYNKDIEELGYKVIGVSADSGESHDKFTQKHNLNFDLVSDPDKSIINEFGVLVTKTMFGKKFEGIQRSTFIINKDGEVIKEWLKVVPLGHAKQVYEYLKTLN